MGNAQHSSKTAEHYTPPDIARAVHKVLGGIDTDPASCERANEIVRATQIYTALDNGLHQPWGRRVYLNPPSGLVREFWNRLVSHTEYDGGVGLWAGFTVEQLAMLQNGTERSPLSYPFVVPKRRIKWVPGDFAIQLGIPGLADDTTKGGGSPTHSNYFCILGGSRAEINRFGRTFRKMGDYKR